MKFKCAVFLLFKQKVAIGNKSVTELMQIFQAPAPDSILHQFTEESYYTQDILLEKKKFINQYKTSQWIHIE